jgi:hypothetical protein
MTHDPISKPNVCYTRCSKEEESVISFGTEIDFSGNIALGT